MTVADVGAGGGAFTVVLGKWIGSGHVYATDITERALRTTREYAEKEGLTNVTVIEGGADRTNFRPHAAMRCSCVMCITTSPRSRRSTRVSMSR